MKDKVVLITGATSGIGKATALKFGAAGAKVVVSGRRESEGNAVVDAIESSGGEATFVRADVAVEDDIKNLVAKTVETYGRLDVAFNNAGVEHSASITEEQREQAIKVCTRLSEEASNTKIQIEAGISLRALNGEE